MLHAESAPKSVLAGMFFDDVVTCAWRLRLALKCEQLEVERRLKKQCEAAPDVPVGQASNSELGATGALELRRQMAILDELQLNCLEGRTITADFETAVTSVFGADFLRSVMEWRPSSLASIMLAEVILEKASWNKRGLGSLAPPADAEQRHRELDSVAQKQMVVKLIESEKRSRTNLFRIVAEIQDRSAVITRETDQLDVCLRYNNAARRDLYRALSVYQEINGFKSRARQTTKDCKAGLQRIPHSLARKSPRHSGD